MLLHAQDTVHDYYRQRTLALNYFLEFARLRQVLRVHVISSVSFAVEVHRKMQTGICRATMSPYWVPGLWAYLQLAYARVARSPGVLP